MPEFYDVTGEIVPVGDLALKKAHSLAMFIQSDSCPGTNLLKCKRDLETGEEIVIFEMEIEIAQKRVYDIKSRERIAVRLDSDDKDYPIVLALREDFPSTPHQLYRKNGEPCSLCLFEDSYEEIKLHWTPSYFIRQINHWLTRTAYDNLHDENQQLEPLLSGSPYTLIISEKIFKDEEFNALEVYCINENFLYVKSKKSESQNEDTIGNLLIAIRTPPVQHGIINSLPKSISQLHEFMHSVCKVNFLPILKNQLLKWKEQKPVENFMQLALIILIILPKKRNENVTQIKNHEFRAFLTTDSIGEVGGKIGAWGWAPKVLNGYTSLLINIDKSQNDKTQNGSNIILVPTNVQFALSREIASIMGGEKQRFDKTITAIGMGALGSQIFLNLVKNGYGEWNLIDNDILMPHNLTKHALSNGIGFPKVELTSMVANNMINGAPIATPINSDIFMPGEKQEEITSTFKDSDIILDMSSSIAVSRHISNDIETNARRFSLFLTPSGFNSVIIAEDAKRNNKLDFMEMQYYRHLINTPNLRNHLKQDIGQFRYSNSCRSVSSTISQDMFALHSANCSRRLKNIWKGEDRSSITIFQTQEDEYSIKCIILPTEDIIELKLDSWVLRTDTWLLKKISEERKQKLPNETGGVLCGSFDMTRRVIYVVDTISSPPDSEEWPDAYIRGKNGLLEKIETINKLSYNKISYIGEWHSHPNGIGPKFSKDDTLHLESRRGRMGIECLPALMLIMGHNDEYRFFVDEIDNYAGGRLE